MLLVDLDPQGNATQGVGIRLETIRGSTAEMIRDRALPICWVQRYVDEEDIPAPSVITLNALAAAHGVNDFLFRFAGLKETTASHDFLYIEPRTGSVRHDQPRKDNDCPECSSAGRFARGETRPLPTRRIGDSNGR